MADPTHVGTGEWNGWIPGCPCRECVEAIAKVYRATDADRRYSALLDLLMIVAGEDWELVNELDDVVGTRLVEAEDRGARAARGEPRGEPWVGPGDQAPGR